MTRRSLQMHERFWVQWPGRVLLMVCVIGASVHDSQAQFYAPNEALIRPSMIFGLGPVRAAVFSPHGNTILCASGAAGLIYDVDTGLVLHSFLGHDGEVTAVAYTPDGKQVLTGCVDGYVRQWEVFSEALLWARSLHVGGVTSMALSADGSLLVTGGVDGKAVLCNGATGLPLRVFSGHTDDVNGVSISADGGTIATASSDATVRVWNTATGETIRTITVSGTVYCVALSADGTTVAAGGSDNNARVWAVSTGTLLSTFVHEQDVMSIAISPSNNTILTAVGDYYHSTQARAYLWQLGSGLPIRAMNLPGQTAFSAAFSADGKRAVIGAIRSSYAFPVYLTSGVAGVWDLSTGQLVRTIESDAAGITSLAVLSDSRTMVSGHSTNQVKVWDLQTGLVVRLLGQHAGPVLAVAAAKNDSRLLTGSGDKTAKIWNTSTGQLLRTLSGHNGAVNCVDFSYNGDLALTGSDDNRLRIWNARTGQLIRTLAAHANGVYSAAFSPDGTMIITGGGDKDAKLWNVQSGTLVRTFSVANYGVGVEQVAFALGGSKVITTQYSWSEPGIHLWDASTGALEKSFNHENNSYSTSLAVSPSEDYLAVTNMCGQSESTDMVVDWDLATGRMLQSMEGYDEPVNSLGFSPDGRLLVTAEARGMIRVWDGRPVAPPRQLGQDGQWFNSVTFWSDGARLSGAAYHDIMTWDVATGRTVNTMTLDRSIEKIALSKDERYYLVLFDCWGAVVDSITGGLVRWLDAGYLDDGALAPDNRTTALCVHSGSVEFWDVATSQQLDTLAANDVTVVAYSPDGTKLATGTEDGMIEIWDVASRQPMHSFFGVSTRKITAIAFSPDGTRVVAGGDALWMWDVATGSFLREFRRSSGTVVSLSFSADGTRLLEGMQGALSTIWDVRTGDILRQVQGWVQSAALSPNGEDFAVATGDGVFLWTVPGPDCNRNNVLDAIDISSGTSQDCDRNGIPDECEVDNDDDGVRNNIDVCPCTIAGTEVDEYGCPPLVPGDFDRDGDVDAEDLQVFHACVTGPALAYDPQNLPAGCTLAPVDGFLPADHDKDGDVDQSDFGVFQRCWSGLNVTANANCAK